jgi:tRNA(Ser,Leu) C12 N-acetylase TAN1
MDSTSGAAKVLVTGREIYLERRTVSRLRRTVPGVRVRRAGFRAVFILDGPGDPLELAMRVDRECTESIGRTVAVLAEVESKAETIKAAAVDIGMQQIAEGEPFCFRVHKRGAHWLEEDTPRLEQELGGAIWEALRQRDGKPPKVDLKNPKIMVVAEVLGLKTLVGIVRKTWRDPAQALP